MDWGFWIVVWLICAVIGAVISERKNLGAGSGFALGGLLGILGVIIVACQKPGLPPAPAGMRSVKCTRCNAVQNVHASQTQFECWQCRTVIPLLSPAGTTQATTPPPNPTVVKAAPVKPKSATRPVSTPAPGVMARGAAVKVLVVGDEHEGRVGTVQTFFDDADDGLDVGVIFKGDNDIFAFARTELRVVAPTGKPAPPRAT
jgi:ribosomal protein S27E